MIIKKRCESEELKVFRQLNLRKVLSEKEKQYYCNLEKGYEGELVFDACIDDFIGNGFILDDLLLEINNTTFQLDKVIITSDKTYMFEVKNYEGDYYIEGDKWFTLSKTEIKNPLLQLQRSVSLLRRFLNLSGYSPTIDAYLIFINPEFHLYHSPIDLPIIYPTQLNRFIKSISDKSKGQLNDRHYKIAESLLFHHISYSDFPYNRLPKCDFNKIEKGILCEECGTTISHLAERHLLVCPKCGFKEGIESAILRTVDEFKLLFPNMKMTTNIIFDWCKIIHSKAFIRKILQANFEAVGHGKSSCFVRKLHYDG